LPKFERSRCCRGASGARPRCGDRSRTGSARGFRVRVRVRVRARVQVRVRVRVRVRIRVRVRVRKGEGSHIELVVDLEEEVGSIPIIGRSG
jgi:hypothetical protein